MSNLCRNRIPLCIEVLLCPHCEIASNTAATSESKEETTLNSHHHSHDVGAAHSNSYVLLEQWTIQQVHTRFVSLPSQTLWPFRSVLLGDRRMDWLADSRLPLTIYFFASQSLSGPKFLTLSRESQTRLY